MGCMLIVDMSMEYTNAVKVTNILSIFSFLLYGQKVEPHRTAPGTINNPISVLAMRKKICSKFY